MDVWSTYQNRIAVRGGNKYGASLTNEIRTLERKLPDSLSYHNVEIFPQEYSYNIDSDTSIEHRVFQNVAIINSDNLNEKTIISMPSEDIRLGSLVHWMDNYWIVIERDANTTVYTRAKLLQCNHLLKWITPEKEILEQWCIIEDGTKYLTGELEDQHFVVTRGDSRISMQISRNDYTVRLDRENRFLIDDDDTPHKLAYLLTKPLKEGLTYNNEGTFKFVLQEVTATEYDNHELGIADYYRYFPKNAPEIPENDGDKKDAADEGKKVWI